MGGYVKFCGSLKSKTALSPISCRLGVVLLYMQIESGTGLNMGLILDYIIYPTIY